MTSRREFLVLLATSTAAIATGKAMQTSSTDVDLSKYKWSMVVQVDKCTECISKMLEKQGIKFEKLPLDKQNELLRNLRPPCVKACDLANNVPRMPDNPRFDCYMIRIIAAKATEDASWRFFPLMCQECEHPACVEVCPTKASYKRPDGIVVIDLHRCIGCRYCMVACPFNARTFTFMDPLEHLEKINPEVPVRKDGVPMKCEFCRWLIDMERSEGVKNPKPVCVQVCPYNALVFGNLKDPNSEVSKIVRTSKVVRLRAGLGTDPKVFYHDL